jgi:hypothetical protein
MDYNIKEAISNKERFINRYISVDFLNKVTNKTKTKYKICILLSGGLRNFEYTHSWINKFLIEPLDADVFVHGWANSNGVQDNVDKINKFSNVKSYQINDISDPNFEYLNHNDKLVTRVFGQFFNLMKCNELRKNYEKNNNIEYDIIIRARPDVFFFSEIEDVDLDYVFKNNSIGIPYEYFKIWSSKLTDTFAMGNRHIMDYYCNSYDTVVDFNFTVGEAESVIDNHIKKSNVNVYNIVPTFIIDNPHDLVTENMDISPKIDNLPYSVTNRILFQNDIK